MMPGVDALPRASNADDLRPWRSLPRVEPPIVLRDRGTAFDDLFDLPPGSAATLAQVTDYGCVLATFLRGTAATVYFPASTIL